MRQFITHNRSSPTIANQDAFVRLTNISVASGSFNYRSLLEWHLVRQGVCKASVLQALQLPICFSILSTVYLYNPDK